MKFLISLIVLFSISANAGILSDKDVKWEQVVGQDNLAVKIYFDANSLHTSTTDSGKISTGNMLFTIDKPKTAIIDGTPTRVRSVVKITILDCNSNVAIPIANFYYDITFPTNADRPVKAFFYDTGDGIRTIDKTSIMHKLFCPEYF